MSDDNDNGDTRTGSSLVFYNVAAKFGEYRSKSELIAADCREAKDVVDRMRDEINVFRETEKYYQLQLSSLQSRLSVMEDRRKSLTAFAEKMKTHEENINVQEEKINSVMRVIEELKGTLQNIIKSTENDVDIIRQNRELRTSLREREAVVSFLKTELESIQTSKDGIINQYASENQTLKEEMRVLKLDMLERKNHCDRVVNSYRNQLESYERTIEQMEMERRSILGDFEVLSDVKEKSGSKENIQNEKGPWPDSTVGCFAEERENNVALTRTTDRSALILNGHANKTQPNQTSNEPQPNFQPRATGSKFPKFGSRQKPKLDFKNSNGDSSQPETKRRLYSPKSNYLF
ncbi:UNVERIFIED_CONTAM: hypothetical protein PYX00_003190 [Menopon gallinae]|uniref:Uncharacterized protein n=1 Tax=Menopon gallinae TaxID=328185 RepID=A0AAW2I0Y7_9NEOP